MSRQTCIAQHRPSPLAKVIRTCTIIINLTLSLSSANTDAHLPKRAIAEEIAALYNSAANTLAV
ncbi:hypothetical protein [Arthrobacter sp. AQ5-05]|uniref:hypothetical protein n=1 Tax=Arthrobacter sp. AQ5-05 TaxID=2184581 RepID=UPI0012B60056|nr:hypothetical protein [Arthrobacter sp. AQ5-05]